MIGSAHGMPLVHRVVQEHRRVVMPLLAALVINILLYAFVVYPLSDRVANVAQREQTAETELRTARNEHAQASGALTGKAQASAELTTFYGDVLPQGLTGARRLTYLRLAQLARQSNLDFQSSRAVDTIERGSTLSHLAIQMQLSGNWDDIRSFLYQLETAPEFVVIDNVQLAEGEEGGALALNLDLSTYYRDTPQ
jgi:Tfp pilus assembly protein PilO